jgi:hypothetical protein
MVISSQVMAVSGGVQALTKRRIYSGGARARQAPAA